jgi:hypothetical protein
MRLITVLCVLGSLVSVPLSLAARQDHHGSSDKQTAKAMGFDQARTQHHFVLFSDGGAIDVSANDPADAKNRDAIRSHLAHIAMIFGEGNFDCADAARNAAGECGPRRFADAVASCADDSRRCSA